MVGWVGHPRLRPPTGELVGTWGVRQTPCTPEDFPGSLETYSGTGNPNREKTPNCRMVEGSFYHHCKMCVYPHQIACICGLTTLSTTHPPQIGWMKTCHCSAHGTY